MGVTGDVGVRCGGKLAKKIYRHILKIPFMALHVAFVLGYVGVHSFIYLLCKKRGNK